MLNRSTCTTNRNLHFQQEDILLTLHKTQIAYIQDLHQVYRFELYYAGEIDGVEHRPNVTLGHDVGELIQSAKSQLCVLKQVLRHQETDESFARTVENRSYKEPAFQADKHFLHTLYCYQDDFLAFFSDYIEDFFNESNSSSK